MSPDTSPSSVPLRWFTCSVCNQVFNTDWPEANAVAEYRATFPGAKDTERATVCPDCYMIVLRTIGVLPRH